MRPLHLISTWALISTVITALSLLGVGRPAVAGDVRNAGLTVIDGDTLSLNGRIIELAGIDAPELGQWCFDGETLYACGEAAAFELRKILILETVTCSPSETEPDRYECLTPDRSLSELLVEDGLAIANQSAELQPAEEKARHIPLGIWRGKFVDPGAWRNGKRLPEELASPSECPVLGMDLDGARVYVVPTDADYDTWKARSGKVGRHFCADEDARGQGYQHLLAGTSRVDP